MLKVQHAQAAVLTVHMKKVDKDASEHKTMNVKTALKSRLEKGDFDVRADDQDIKVFSVLMATGL